MATLIDANQAMFTPFEPKLKNRYVMAIDGIPAYLIKTANRPSISFEEVELNHMNVKRFVKGKGTCKATVIRLPSGCTYTNQIGVFATCAWHFHIVCFVHIHPLNK